MIEENILERAFEFLNSDNFDEARKIFEKVLEEDETNGDAAFGLFLCTGKNADFDEIVHLLQIVVESDSEFKFQAQKFLNDLISPDDLDLYNKLDALTNKANEFEEIFDALQNSSGKLQNRLIENRADEVIEEMHNIADSFTDDDVYKIQNAVIDEDEQEIKSENHIENKIEEILNTLRENYLNGELDSAEAFDLFLQIAEMGNAEAMTTVAFMCSVGNGTEQDIHEAIYWYRRAAELEYSDAMCNLAYIYIYRLGIDENYKIGLKWLEKAIEFENIPAIFLLGECYLNGWGVEENHKTAVRYFEQAAENGNVDALMTLGIIYRNEDDEFYNLEKSQECFQKSVLEDFSNDKIKCYPVGNDILEYYRGQRQF